MQTAGQTGSSRAVIVVGGGIGGLAAAAELAARGLDVTVLEAAAAAGGKLRQVTAGGLAQDAGPTVFTMRWVFDELFQRAGERFDSAVTLHPAPVLARHGWPDGSRLDLFADRDRSAQAIADFAGPEEAGRFLGFCERAARVYAALEQPFIRAMRPASPAHLLWRGGLAGLPGLARISPFRSLWTSLAHSLHDARLRQLFGRYATYCGSSPFEAPGTLMLVAHVEQQGVWLVEGGMVRLADSVAALLGRHGGRLRTGAAVRRVLVKGGCATGVELAGGEQLQAQAVIFNGDAAALAGCLGEHAAQGPAARAARSLSAVTWNLAGIASGFPLQRHNVFFSADSRAEFDTLFRERRLPDDPTVYLCAQDRGAGDAAPAQAERLFCLVNAPADGDHAPPPAHELQRLQEATQRQLARHGLALELGAREVVRRTPQDFERLYPGTGGALYGRASHGWRASFQRPGSRTAVAGLYQAGGSTHPGAGVPMAALSGRLAAQCVLRQFGLEA